MQVEFMDFFGESVVGAGADDYVEKIAESHANRGPTQHHPDVRMGHWKSTAHARAPLPGGCLKSARGVQSNA